MFETNSVTTSLSLLYASSVFLAFVMSYVSARTGPLEEVFRRSMMNGWSRKPRQISRKQVVGSIVSPVLLPLVFIILILMKRISTETVILFSGVLALFFVFAGVVNGLWLVFFGSPTLTIR